MCIDDHWFAYYRFVSSVCVCVRVCLIVRLNVCEGPRGLKPHHSNLQWRPIRQLYHCLHLFHQTSKAQTAWGSASASRAKLSVGPARHRWRDVERCRGCIYQHDSYTMKSLSRSWHRSSGQQMDTWKMTGNVRVRSVGIGEARTDRNWTERGWWYSFRKMKCISSHQVNAPRQANDPTHRPQVHTFHSLKPCRKKRTAPTLNRAGIA